MLTIKSNTYVRRHMTTDEMIAYDWAKFRRRRAGFTTFRKPLRTSGPWRCPGHKSFNRKPRRYTGATFGR